nr:Ribonuclease P protein component 4 like [Ipomoea batatas]
MLQSSPDVNLFFNQAIIVLFELRRMMQIKAPHRNKKPRNSPQNYVVYTCQFCSHRNLKRGTARGYLKQICPPKDRPSTKGDHIALPDEPSTPSLRMDFSLLDSKRKRRNKSGLKKPVESESISTAMDVDQAICTSNKRKRKSWVTLKEMAQSSGQDKSTQFSNISVPFFL